MIHSRIDRFYLQEPVATAAQGSVSCRSTSSSLSTGSGRADYNQWVHCVRFIVMYFKACMYDCSIEKNAAMLDIEIVMNPDKVRGPWLQ